MLALPIMSNLLNEGIIKMYKKSYLLLMLSCVSISIHTMEWTEETVAQALRKMTAEEVEASMHARNRYGHTPLHIAILHPDERDKFYPQYAYLLSAEDRIPENYDKQSAHKAAQYIKAGSRVDIKDKAGHAAWWIAKKNKAIFPHIYAVIMAGRIAQYWNPPVPAPQNGSTYTLGELLAWEHDDASQKYLTDWGNAQKILDEYASEKEQGKDYFSKKYTYSRHMAIQ